MLSVPPALPIITGTAKIWRRALPGLEPSGSTGPSRVGIMIPFPVMHPRPRKDNDAILLGPRTLRRGIPYDVAWFSGYAAVHRPHAPTIPAQVQAGF